MPQAAVQIWRALFPDVLFFPLLSFFFPSDDKYHRLFLFFIPSVVDSVEREAAFTS